MNIQYDDTLSTYYPEYHRSVLNKVQTLKEYSINLTILSRKICDEIKSMTLTIQEYSINMKLCMEITDDRNIIERVAVISNITEQSQ